MSQLVNNINDFSDESKEEATGRKIVLEVNHIVKSYRRRFSRKKNVVLIDANLTISAGEIVGLVGENGSGKSTLMKIIVGAIGADKGSVGINGSFGYCPQEPLLYERLTCDEHFELFGDAYSLDHSTIERNRNELYEVLDFINYRENRVEELSGGTKAKLNLGLALLHKPDVLLLDEPYAGFDWDTYLRFWELTGKQRAEGRAILIISHFVADEERFDRIIKLHEGKTLS